MSCEHSKFKLEEEDRYYVKSEEHNNCCLCLVNDKGPMTQEEIGDALGYTKMRICQIEKRALEKLAKRVHLYVEKNDFLDVTEPTFIQNAISETLRKYNSKNSTLVATKNKNKHTN